DGLYSVGYVVDAGDAIDEISETNNSAFAGTLRVGPAPANSGTPDDVEPNDAFSSATNLGTLGQASFTTGSISTTTDDDYFVFTAAESGQATITVSFSDNVGDIDATLTNAAGNTLDSGTSTNDDEVLTASVVEGEQYFIRVYGWSGAINTYGLDVNAPGVDTEGPVLATASFDRDATQQVRFTFDELIDPSAVSAGDLVLENLSTGEVFNVSTLAFAVGGREATWAVSQGSPLLGNGVWEATLPGTSVTDINGNNAAGDASFTFDVLAGDANFDRTVDLADFGILRANFGSTNSLFAQGDFNYDGSVDLADFGLLRSSFGQTLGMPGSLFADDEA
ncbi:MAG: Ig-like domain-containing protein, partial [Planctomycetota bacterium]